MKPPAVKPLVSFIMPTFNRGHIIKTAIASIVRQTIADWELIIVDDGSTDNTRAVIGELKNPHIRYYWQKNKGPSAARNLGVAKAKAKWVAYLDSDNELLPRYLATMLEWLGKNPQAVFVLPRANRTLELYKKGKRVKLIDNSADTPPKFTIKDIFMKTNHLDTNGFMHLRRLFKEGIRWDEDLTGMEDWELAMSIGEQYPNGFLYVPVVLYNYHQRYGGDGVISNTDYQHWADTFEYIYQKHKDDKLLKGQKWYPQRVKKWHNLQKQFELGKQPPYHLYYFQGK